MKRRAKPHLAVLVLATVLFMPSCSSIRNLHGRPELQRQEAPSKSSNGAMPSDLQEPSRVVAPGVIEPWRGQIDLSSHEPGWIAQVLVTEGQAVEAGQLLTVLDDQSQRAAVEIARADLAEAEATLAKTLRGATAEELRQARAEAEATQAKAALAQRDADRIVQLGGELAISPAEVDRACSQAKAEGAFALRSAARVAEVSRGARSEDRSIARERVAAARARLELARSNLERRHVVAPARATVLQSRFHAGEYFNLGAAPLFILGDVSKLQVRMEVDEIDAFRVKLGQPCSLFGDDDARLGKGEVFRLAPKIGRRGLAIESPTARVDVRVREVYVEVAAADGLVPGRRVWGHVALDR